MGRGENAEGVDWSGEASFIVRGWSTSSPPLGNHGTMFTITRLYLVNGGFVCR